MTVTYLYFITQPCAFFLFFMALLVKGNQRLILAIKCKRDPKWEYTSILALLEWDQLAKLVLTLPLFYSFLTVNAKSRGVEF